MEYRQLKNLIAERVKKRTALYMACIFLIVAILAGFYLNCTWNTYQQMATSEATQLARSVRALLHVEHIEALVSGDPAAAAEGQLVDQALAQLVETTDSVYYAYILKQQDGNIAVVADSSAADSSTSRPTKRSCEKTASVNLRPFETGESLLTSPIPLPCGNWIRVLVPIYDAGGQNVIAVLGLSYSAAEWKVSLWKKMIPDIIIVLCLAALVFVLFHLLQKNARYQEAEISRQESERSKSVFFSQIPGVAYRCRNNENWTMEFASDGCRTLTGYRAESLVADREISYREIISPEYRNRVRDKWNRALAQRKRYHGEYEITTKSGERKWVLELGEGIYNDAGEVEALEGVVLDISEQKKKDFQIARLRDLDFLTGLYNRSYIEQEKKRLDQPDFWPLSFSICDIDGLRMVNDAYGQEEGDRLIVQTARLLQSCLRPDDVLGHAGGGEFMLLMPCTDSHSASQIKSDIQNAVESYNRANEKALYAISVTIGHATKVSNNQTIQEVTRETEKYLNRRKLLNQSSSHSAIVSSIMATLYAKSQETEAHGNRLCSISQMIGERLGLPQKELDDLQLLSKLHDIGKIGIADHILNKPDKLTASEWEIMKQHPAIGHRIAKSTPQLEHIAEYILHHHERWDGTGYPAGLIGDKTPILSRILTIADSYDAMTENRIYRKALSKEAAIKEIERNIGTQFDPHIARLFLDIIATP